MDALATIESIDQQIDANRAALIARVSAEPISAADWQDAWDAHPDLWARDCDLFRQRGVAQLGREEQDDERVQPSAPAAIEGEGYTVHYQHDVWAGRPLADPCTCRHPGMMAFPIGSRIEPRGRGGRLEVAYDAIVCMDCGTDGTGQIDLIGGLTMAYQEAMRLLATPFLWRTYDLVEHRRADLAGQPIPLWMAIPLGLSRDEINAGMRAARTQRCADYMGERMARYAEAA